MSNLGAVGEGPHETDRELRARIERLRVELREALDEWDQREAEHQPPEKRRLGFRLLKGSGAVALVALLAGTLKHRPALVTTLAATLAMFTASVPIAPPVDEPEPWFAVPTPESPVAVNEVSPPASPSLPPAEEPPAEGGEEGAEGPAGAVETTMEAEGEPVPEVESPEPEETPRESPAEEPTEPPEEPEPEPTSPPTEPPKRPQACRDLDLRPVVGLGTCIKELLDVGP